MSTPAHLTPFRSRQHRSGFTLIEVLVVVAIIALLVAILLPSLSRARAQARHAQCLSNLKQFGTAVLGYSIQSKGVIPGNSGELGTNWAVIVAREYGQRPKHVNDVDVKTEEAFHCPERERYQPQPFVDYVVNALTPEGPNPGGVHTGFRWDPLPEWHRIDRYKRSSETVYILDAEREDRVPHKDPKAKPAPDWPRGPSVHAARVNWYDGDYDLGALDIMDVRTGSHLPQGKNGSNVSDAIGYRRAARKMHLDRYTNAVYFDGHAAGELIVNLGSDIDNYGHWLRLFGIKDVETAKQIHMD